MSFIGLTLYKVPSTRCPYKHHAEFAYGKTLVEIKIEQLLRGGADHVYVSTNDTNVKKHDKVTFLDRPNVFCDEKYSSWSNTLQHIYDSIPLPNNQLIMFTTTMVPLFARYNEMLELYKKTDTPLVTVHPSKHYYMTDDKMGANFSFGHWHSYSQAMKPMYQLAYGTMAPIGKLRETGYTFPKIFDYFELDSMECLDIDTKDEFELGQIMYKRKFNE